MKTILSLFLLWSLYIVPSFGQYTFMLTGFPKKTPYRIIVLSPGVTSEFKCLGDTSILIKGHKPLTKIYIQKNGQFPIPAKLSGKSGTVIFYYRKDGYQIYVNCKLQYQYVRPVKRAVAPTEKNAPGYPIIKETESIETPWTGAADMEIKSYSPPAHKGMSSYKSSKTTSDAFTGYEGKSGVLTAGEINDFSKWKLWNDLNEGELNIYKKQWKLDLYKRYSVMVMNRSRIPIVNASVKLYYKKQIFWEGKTDNTGKAELWVELTDSILLKQEHELYIEVISGEQVKTIRSVKPIEKGINKVIFNEECREWNQADIAFIVDATGSMGDEINYLKSELQDVMGRCKTTMPAMNFRLGSVFYRDRGDEYITRFSPLHEDPNQTISFIQKQRAGGGGDEPEGVDTALSVALSSLNWNPNAVARLAFLVLDAPPHNDPQTQLRMQLLTRQAAKQGIRLIPLTASGIGKTTEYLMRTLALATNGTYLFLTDDSGVGGSHLKPSTDHYKVELLNNLLIRIIRNYIWHPGCDREISPQQDSLVIQNDTVIISEPIDSLQPEQSYFRAYPNPTEGPITLESSGFEGSLYLTDMNGKILERYEMERKEQLKLNLMQYPPGIYYFKYLMTKGTKDLKVILMRP